MDTKSWQLPVKRLPTRQKVDRSIVWNNSHVCYEQNCFGQVTCTQYNNSGNQIGCVSTNQVLLLRVPHSDGAVWNEQSARRCYSLRFRDDDKMTIQTIEQRVVVKSTETAFERQFSGHTRDARDALFLSKQTFASGSDDTTVRVWDLLSQAELGVGKAHTDYVRSVAYHSDGCFYSASYDHTIMLWDVRTNLSSPSVTLRSSNDGPVEQMIYVPDKQMIVSSSSDVVTVFDARTNTPLAVSSQHTKAVTAIAYSAAHDIIITGSLDQRVKFLAIEGGELTTIASKKYDHGVTSVAIHPQSAEFAVGMVNGLFQISKLDTPFAVKAKDDTPPEDREIDLLPSESKLTPAERKEAMFQKRIAAVRQLFVVYQYHKALKSALYSRMPDVIVSTLEELQRRGALHVALSGHNDRAIVQLLRFASESLDQPNLSDLMFVVLDLIFAIYAEAAGMSEFFHRELLLAHRRIGEALRALRAMEETMGIMELIAE